MKLRLAALVPLFLLSSCRHTGDLMDDEKGVYSVRNACPIAGVPAAAQDRGLTYVDATCPLVSKVHRQAERLSADGRHILFIGHGGHPEVNRRSR